MFTIQEVKSLLGDPVILIELTDEQIQLNIDISEAEARDLVRIYGCADYLDYVTEKLTLINCKKNWAMVINKYNIVSNSEVVVTNHAYNSAIYEEHMLFDLLTGYYERYRI